MASMLQMVPSSYNTEVVDEEAGAEAFEKDLLG